MGKTRGDRKARFTTRAGCIRLGSLVSLSKFSDNFSDKHILRQTRFDVSPYLPKYTREDSNLQPPVPKTGGEKHEPVSQQQVTATAAQVSASVSPKAHKAVSESDSKAADRGCRKRKSEPAVTASNGSSDVATSGDFTAAMAMIASLPLSDAEKAEAVRRLLSNRE